MHTFFLEPNLWHAPYILEGQEARHLTKALRLKNGDRVRLLDGAGRSGEFAILATGKNSVELEFLREETHPEPRLRCWLAAAYTKAARRAWLLEKAVELEAAGIWFWQAEHSQAKVPDEHKENWREQLIAGAKQCLNPWLPELRTFTGGAGALAARMSAGYPKFARIFLLWEGQASDNMLCLDDLTPAQPGNRRGQPESLLFIMGPEGGLSAKEVDLFLKNGARALSLGRRILRWETAALLCLGLSYWAGQLEASGVFLHNNEHISPLT
ncbi:MAG: 16S rRNA (uracil(1498)-N(3))-methyltransferase [Deltaproteobacteria bacterium]|jgi:16S rRNA (uracil1498-N3)-methyltransferase|nr:16S rRNA (uracil(1498)-N(3))-methyltransferase [Deltaproteobacteria bacterium]